MSTSGGAIVSDQEACCSGGTPPAPTPGAAAPAPASASLTSLTKLRRGQTGVVCESSLRPDDEAMLRAMGLFRSARVRLCRVGEPCIVAVSVGCGCAGTCRIGLARPLAERIMVAVDTER